MPESCVRPYKSVSSALRNVRRLNGSIFTGSATINMQKNNCSNQGGKEKWRENQADADVPDG